MAHQQHAECIEACYACADACDHCAVACLAEDDPRIMARCIELDMDCAQVCRLAATYMARDFDTSPFYGRGMSEVLLGVALGMAIDPVDGELRSGGNLPSRGQQQLLGRAWGYADDQLAH
jgi:hypothetical protein